jgi:hypothetical protein
MKLSKAVIVVFVLGLAVIAGGLIYTVWQNELDRKDTLNATLDTARVLLPPIQAGIATEEANLKAAQAKLAAARAGLEEFKAKFPTPPPQAAIQSIDYGTKLFILAANNGLNLSEFHASDPSTVTQGGIKYQKTSMDVMVSGPIGNINNFIGNLETGDDYLTATIDSVDISLYIEYDAAFGGVPPPDATITINLMALEG